MIGWARSALVLATLVAVTPAVGQNFTYSDMPIAVLQGLDKVTARISTFDAPVNEIVSFGTLRIEVKSCRKRPPEEPPESAAFLDILDDRPGEPAKPVFAGWMFASSPALNALEHPVYDVWVKDCRQPELAPVQGPDEQPETSG
ncbi:MAG: DUF2155 domain-containing protein [Alphaproteobacteria bacterium]|nr:DUF2155 domain-containing protein [Alphaproteobacteria bacterium]